jgi:hypothetical protein
VAPFELIWIRNIELARQFDREQYERLLGFPDDIPDLSRLRPPGGNTRATGVEECHFARRLQNRLAETY